MSSRRSRSSSSATETSNSRGCGSDGWFGRAGSHWRRWLPRRSSPPAPRFGGAGGVTPAFGSSAPATERAIVRCLVGFKHGKDVKHLGEVVFGFTEILFELNTEQDQADLHHSAYPLRRMAPAGTSGSSTCCLAETLPREPSERVRVARRRSFPGQCDGISRRERLKPSSVEGKTRHPHFSGPVGIQRLGGIVPSIRIVLTHFAYLPITIRRCGKTGCKRILTAPQAPRTAKIDPQSTQRVSVHHPDRSPGSVDDSRYRTRRRRRRGGRG